MSAGSGDRALLVVPTAESFREHFLPPGWYVRSIHAQSIADWGRGPTYRWNEVEVTLVYGQNGVRVEVLFKTMPDRAWLHEVLAAAVKTPLGHEVRSVERMESYPW